MKYWDDMQDKFAFNDGGYMPGGAYLFRDVYCKAVSAIAAQLGSKVRAVPYDRPGCHNSILIEFVPADWFEKFFLPDQTGRAEWDSILHLYEPDTKPDAEFHAAVSQAQDMNLDEYVIIEAKIDPEFEKKLAAGFK